MGGFEAQCIKKHLIGEGGEGVSLASHEHNPRWLTFGCTCAHCSGHSLERVWSPSRFVNERYVVGQRKR